MQSGALRTNSYGCYLSTYGGIAVELLVSIIMYIICVYAYVCICINVKINFKIYTTSFLFFKFRIVSFLDAPPLSHYLPTEG